MNENEMVSGGGGFLYVLAIIFLFAMMGGGFGFGGNRGPAPASADQVAQGFNNQNMQQILLSSANNNYETAQLITGLGNTLQQQNNTNLINAIQGFNAINISLQNLGAQLDSCCCKIQTTMLQNRYEDERAKNVALQGEISNFQQSQYLLGQMGRWVAWLGSGTQPAASTGT